MSASEKLKALDGRITLAQGSEWDADWLLPAEPWIADIAAFRNALPQIVAVVEAAERRDDGDWPDPWNRLDAALAALDEALS